MRPSQIEAWALGVLDRVEQKQNIEDIRVELKSEWPKELNRAARQLGGRANVARGEPILWLIGVDEKAGKVAGASFAEFANWYPGIEKEFDGIAPHCSPLNVPYHGTSVVALCIETDRQPYVVRNAAHGKSEGGPVCWEVPWRRGARTDSATRADLLRLLVPVARLPEVELLAMGLWAAQSREPNQPAVIEWRLDVYLFVSPHGDSPVVIPSHRCECTIEPSEAPRYLLDFGDFSFGCEGPGNVVAKKAVTVSSPGLVIIVGRYRQPGFSLPLQSKTVTVIGKSRPIGADASIDWTGVLERRFPERQDYVGIWGVGPFTSF